MGSMWLIHAYMPNIKSLFISLCVQFWHSSSSNAHDNRFYSIFQNTSEATDSLPVMIYIHGGGFFAGSPSGQLLGPQNFMDNGQVILVLMAYRLGALGFLSTGDDNSPGNFGLKDQAMAMKWVRENIREFGGDSDSITIFGSSAGGASVHMHMMSPLSKGAVVFSRFIR